MFHFSQAVYRNIQKIGLVDEYNSDTDGHRRLLRLIMALPLLPRQHIVPAFEKLIENVNPDNVKLCQLVQYFRKTWIDNKTFTPFSWCWFNKAIRTNNDLEGYHNKLNIRADGKSFSVYKLINLLGKEATDVKHNSILLQEGELKRYQKKTTIRNHRRLQEQWDDYILNPIEYTFQRLLDRGSYCIKPSTVWKYEPCHEIDGDTSIYE